MGQRRGKYSDDDLEAAVQAVLAGARMTTVRDDTGIPYNTLKKYVSDARKGVKREKKRPGPKPLLPKEAEENLRDWVLGRQHAGHPVGRQELLEKAQQVAQLVSGLTVGEGWLRRFMERHPSLTLRASQSVSKCRNEVEERDLSTLFSSLAKVMIEQNIGAARVFNADETAISTTREQKQVIVAKGSKNVWHKDVKTHFHLSFVACGSASGFVVPPLCIFPGKSVDDDIFDRCEIPGVGAATTEKGFMIAPLFARSLQFFSNAVPTPIKRPLLLVMDGCASHISLPVVDAAESLGIILVCLPANGTHLLQPLDVAVFSPFKTSLKLLLNKLLPRFGDVNVDKQTALGVAALAWNYACLSSNLVAGFRSCGIFPLSRVNMHAKLANFERNGLPSSHRDAAWLQVCDIQEIMMLPARAARKTKRKRKNTSGRILTRKLLEEDSKTPSKRAKQPKRLPARKPQVDQPEIVTEAWV